jgi:hypothetical protein
MILYFRRVIFDFSSYSSMKLINRLLACNVAVSPQSVMLTF